MAEQLLRILYLEDDPLISELTILALQDMGGLIVHHCSSGQEAIEQAADFVPQMLLFDVMLPIMDGPQTYDRIKRLPGCGDVPVIFMTAKAQKHQEQAYLELGACGVIAKPFDPLTLADQLRLLWSTTRRG